MKQIRVLNKIKLLGEWRKHNDFLSEEEYYKIPPNVRQSLISQEALEVYDDGSQLNVSVQKLNAKIDLLSDILQDSLGIKLSEYFNNKDSKKEKKEKVVEKSVYSEGDSALFADEDGVAIEGTIIKVYRRKKVVDVKDKEGGVWEVAFSDLLIED